MIFAMEQLQEEVWVNIGYGEFSSLEDAMAETAEFANNLVVPLDELRVRAEDEIPEGVLKNCKCGGRLMFTADCRTICETCHTVIEIGEDS